MGLLDKIFGKKDNNVKPTVINRQRVQIKQVFMICMYHGLEKMMQICLIHQQGGK